MLCFQFDSFLGGRHESSQPLSMSVVSMNVAISLTGAWRRSRVVDVHYGLARMEDKVHPSTWLWWHVAVLRSDVDDMQAYLDQQSTKWQTMAVNPELVHNDCVTFRLEGKTWINLINEINPIL